MPLAAGVQGSWGKLAELHNSVGTVTAWHMWKWHSLELLSAQPVQLSVWFCGMAFPLHLFLGLLSALSPFLGIHVCVIISVSISLSLHLSGCLCAWRILWFFFSILILPNFSSFLISLIYFPSPVFLSYSSLLLEPPEKDQEYYF